MFVFDFLRVPNDGYFGQPPKLASRISVNACERVPFAISTLYTPIVTTKAVLRPHQLRA